MYQPVCWFHWTPFRHNPCIGADPYTEALSPATRGSPVTSRLMETGVRFPGRTAWPDTAENLAARRDQGVSSRSTVSGWTTAVSASGIVAVSATWVFTIAIRYLLRFELLTTDESQYDWQSDTEDLEIYEARRLCYYDGGSPQSHCVKFLLDGDNGCRGLGVVILAQFYTVSEWWYGHGSKTPGILPLTEAIEREMSNVCC